MLGRVNIVGHGLSQKKKKIVKVIEDDIYDKLLEIYKGTEMVVLVKFVEAIPFSGSHFSQWKAPF